MADVNLNGKHPVEKERPVDMTDCALMNEPSTSKQALKKRGPNSKIIINAGTTTAPQKADPMPAVNGPPELEKREPTKKPNTRLQKRLAGEQTGNGAHTATDQSSFLMSTLIDPQVQIETTPRLEAPSKPNTRLQNAWKANKQVMELTQLLINLPS
ncbi:uncharacterized protein LOC133848286 isoform X1 [Drosophila sulfurigaster albostrigata]|uniref:uncharacterized protein LOC133848286 isoform X1 n=1 Tax=Drosophila sulfurigaster albostrigata TaxID=89887 RepID=UPI002D21A225|nr:uncharacterized protein LOC133848286 isoform X1 [Drosophila sulfurigaster albostrigata]